MSRIEASLRAVVKDLQELGCDFALVGGFAVSAHTAPRTMIALDRKIAWIWGRSSPWPTTRR